MRPFFWCSFLFLAHLRFQRSDAEPECISGSFANAETCDFFLQCDHGHYIRIPCPPTLHWNQELKVCDWPQNAHCEDQPEYLTQSHSLEPEAINSSENPETDNMFFLDAGETNQATESAEKLQESSTDGSENSSGIGDGFEVTNLPQQNNEDLQQITTVPSNLENQEEEVDDAEFKEESYEVVNEEEPVEISLWEFACAVRTKGGFAKEKDYIGFTKSLVDAGIKNKVEAAQILAHELWETVGFQYLSESYCEKNLASCASAYPNNHGGLDGIVYYGRGMLQLTWDYNYAAASQALFGDDRLLRDPDQVAKDRALAFLTAAWFWKENVHKDKPMSFGDTLKSINGALECDGGPNSQFMKIRHDYYNEIRDCFSLEPTPDEDGYCHV